MMRKMRMGNRGEREGREEGVGLLKGLAGCYDMAAKRVGPDHGTGVLVSSQRRRTGSLPNLKNTKRNC